MPALQPTQMAMNADDVIVGRTTDVFTSLRHGLPQKKGSAAEG